MFPRRAWLMAMRRVLATAPDRALGYPALGGAEPARVAVSDYLNRARGTAIRADRIVMCTGFAQGLRLVCEVLRAHGVTAVAVEDPCHAEQRRDVEAMGLGTVAVPVDAGGMQVDRLRRLDVGAVLVTPAHQYPTGAVLAPDRRAALLDWAARRRAVILEDDFDAEYRYDREPVGALQGLAPDLVVYLGSTSKVLAPALRLGWAALPDRLAGDVARAKLQADRGSPVLEQLALADFLERGELDRHVRRTRRLYSRRRDLLVATLADLAPRLRVQGVAAGIHLMIELAPRGDEQAIIDAAARASVRVYGVRAHRKQPGGPPALLLGYGALSDRAIVEGIKRLAAVIPAAR
jgi:GntR family transcriptional regulator/MocR family aminotransferase